MSTANPCASEEPRGSTLSQRAVLGIILWTAACGGHSFVSRQESPASTLVLRRVRVFDAPRAKLLEGVRDVVIRNGRIIAIETEAASIPGARTLEGGTVIPGLIDLHVHLGSGSAPPWKLEIPNQTETLEAFLFAGVTTVLDVGNRAPAVFLLRDALARKERLGPRLYAAGPIFTAPQSHPLPILQAYMPGWIAWYLLPQMVRPVPTVKDAAGLVAAVAADKPDVVKIVMDRIPTQTARMTSEIITELVKEVHRHGLKAVAHIGRSVDVVDAVNAGIDALVHNVYLEEISDEAVELLARHAVPVIATISVFDSLESLAADGPRNLSRMEQAVVDPKVAASFFPVPLEHRRGAFADWIVSVKAGHQARRTNVAKLLAAGVKVLAGSDSPNVAHFPGAGLHVELDRLAEAGMSCGEALRAATFDNAQFLAGRHADFGEVAVGKRADLVVLRALSLDTIEAVHDVVEVIVDGAPLLRRPRTPF
jgi:enamidase